MILVFKLFTFWSNRFFSVIPLIFLFSVSSVAWSLPEPCWPEIVNCIDPYLGIDMGLRRMAWKKDYGDNVYKHSAYQPNIYTGLQFNQFFGVEVGYEEIISKQRNTVIIQPGQNITILNTSFRNIVSLTSKVKLSGWHFNIVGICPLNYCECIDLLGTVGLASLKTTQQMNIVGADQEFVNPPLTVTFSKKKVAPRVSAGFQYKISDNFKLRFILVGIENTTLELGPSKEVFPDNTFRTIMKHHTYHSAGVIFNF